VQLLERSARGAKLTDAGSRLYEHASCGIEALLEAEQAVVSDQARLKGRLRLSLPQTVEPWWELLAAFQRRYPDIQVYVYSTERRVDLIEDGIDVALRVGAIMHEAMVARRILSFRNIVVASPELVERLACRTSRTRSIASQAVGVAHRCPCPGIGRPVIEPKAVLSTNDYHHLCSRALGGDVVTEPPPFLAAAPIREKRLVPLLPQYPLPEWPINQSALSASSSPIHYRQDIPGLLPELSPENRSGLRNLS
jgi:DNA-binding transcriptional LysR family regulator